MAGGAGRVGGRGDEAAGGVAAGGGWVEGERDSEVDLKRTPVSSLC